MKTRQEMLIEFHKAIGQPIEGRPTVPADARVRLRAKLIAEEFFETMFALFGVNGNAAPMAIPWLSEAHLKVMQVIDECRPGVDLVELADGLADLDYVVEGTRLEFGIDGESIAEEVHRTNLLKVGGTISPEGKRLKPPGWEPPRIEMILEVQKSMWTLGEIVADLDEEADVEHYK